MRATEGLQSAWDNSTLLVLYYLTSLLALRHETTSTVLHAKTVPRGGNIIIIHELDINMGDMHHEYLS